MCFKQSHPTPLTYVLQLFHMPVRMGLRTTININGVAGIGGLENVAQRNVKPDCCALSHELQLQVKDTGKI
jgi:hypothetical protein